MSARSQHDGTFAARLRRGEPTTGERREWLRDLGERLRAGGEFAAAALAVLRQLAGDARWEVRQDVAELLVYVAEPSFSALAGQLQADANAYVQRAADRAVARRRRAEVATRRLVRDLEQLGVRRDRLAGVVGRGAADQALRLADERFGRMADALTHDLLNVLTGLDRQVSELARTVAGDAAATHAAAQVQAEVRYLAGYLRDFAAYAKTAQVARRPERLREVATQALRQARAHLTEQGLQPEPVQVTVQLPDLRFDLARELLTQALANLLVNAHEAFLADGELRPGTITVAGREDGGYVMITVKDNGCGMSPEELAALRLYLPGRKNRRKRRSHGLGLLSARKCVEAHDGWLAVASALGQGTTVTITLPVPPGE